MLALGAPEISNVEARFVITFALDAVKVGENNFTKLKLSVVVDEADVELSLKVLE